MERLRGDGRPGEGGRRLEGAPQHELDDAAGAVALVPHGQIVEAEPKCLEEALDFPHPAQGQGRPRKVERLHTEQTRPVCARDGVRGAWCALRVCDVFAACMRRAHAACACGARMRCAHAVHMQLHTAAYVRCTCMRCLHKDQHARPSPQQPRAAPEEARQVAAVGQVGDATHQVDAAVGHTPAVRGRTRHVGKLDVLGQG